MCLKVLTKHKPYCITGLVKEETIYKTKYVQKWGKKSLYLVHFKNNPNTHFGNVQKPPKRRLEKK